MKKLKKRFISVSLALVLTLSSALPAYAGNMRNFALQSSATYDSNLTRAIQVMCIHHNAATRTPIKRSGGADGIYGTSTVKAVKAFQESVQILNDGICGSNTWSHFEKDALIFKKDKDVYRIYMGKYNTIASMKQNRNTLTWFCHTDDKWIYVG